MFISYSIGNSPFHRIASFLAERYHLPSEKIQSPLMDFVIDGVIPLELQEDGSKAYLIGSVVESPLVTEDHEALSLLRSASAHLGMTEGTLAWDEEKKRIVFWLDVTSYTEQLEFNEYFNRFLNHLDTWISLVPRT
ncbi:MAG: type III secretion system chaperone [Chthoniobacterales bacterium]|nr:type III secretion system chaperone [Chthoniobacterales bacterium]